MADDFATSFIRSYSAVKDIRARKEDREYLKEQRARQRKQDATEDAYKKESGAIHRGERQVATDPASATFSPEDMAKGMPDGYTMVDAPAPMQVEKKSPLGNMATKLADGVKNKVSELFGMSGAAGTGSLGTFDNEGGGAFDDPSKVVTSEQLGATRQMTKGERWRALAGAAAEARPELALQYAMAADKEDTLEIRRVATRSSNTWDGVEKTYGQFNNGRDLKVERIADGENKGKWRVHDGEDDLGVHDSSQAFFRRVVAPAIEEDPSATVAQWNQFASEDLQKEKLRSQDDHQAAMLALAQTKERNDQVLAAAQMGQIDITNKANLLAINTAQRTNGLITEFDELSLDPYKNRARLSTITNMLATTNPEKYTATTKVRDAEGNETPVVINLLQAGLDANMPKFAPARAGGKDDPGDIGEVAAAKVTLSAALAARAADPDAMNTAIAFIEKRHGKGAIEMLADEDPEIASILQQAERQTTPAKQWGLPAEHPRHSSSLPQPRAKVAAGSSQQDELRQLPWIRLQEALDSPERRYSATLVQQEIDRRHAQIE